MRLGASVRRAGPPRYLNGAVRARFRWRAPPPHRSRLANTLVAIEALVGLLGFAVLSGLLFARFTRPTAKISFSRNAIVAPYRDGWALMFRLANLRNHDLTDVHAVVSFSRWVEDNGRRRRRFDTLSDADPEIVCLISADDETFAQTVHAKTSYDKTDIVWGARFGDMYLSDTDRVAIDLARLHDLETIGGPERL